MVLTLRGNSFSVTSPRLWTYLATKAVENYSINS